MTDTLNKTHQSCTGSDTPETDAVLKQFEHHLPNWLASEIMAEVARRLERERDEWKAAHDNQAKLKRIISDRPDLKERAKLVAKLIKERDEWKEVAKGSLLGAIRDRDEAVNSCQIWQRGHSKLVADRDDWKRLAVEQEKQIAKQLTILQEHGLAEYGN
jgi:hypothetical protein